MLQAQFGFKTLFLLQEKYQITVTFYNVKVQREKK